jgi:hypothetical protein
LMWYRPLYRAMRYGSTLLTLPLSMHKTHPCVNLLLPLSHRNWCLSFRARTLTTNLIYNISVTCYKNHTIEMFIQIWTHWYNFCDLKFIFHWLNL